MFNDFSLPMPTGNPAQAQDSLRSSLEVLIKYGYDAVVINRILTGKLVPKETNPIKFVESLNGTGTAAFAPAILRARGRTGIRQLSRVTVRVEDTSLQQQLTQSYPGLATYDIIAVRPVDEKSFNHCCHNLDCDIISVDLSERLSFNFKFSTIGAAIERGIFFEICYAPAIRDQTARRNLISNAAALVRTSRGRNLIISSEATDPFELRGPYDIINLGTLFGLNEAETKAAITINARAAIYKAETRKNSYKGFISAGLPIQESANQSSGRGWKTGDMLSDFIPFGAKSIAPSKSSQSTFVPLSLQSVVAQLAAAAAEGDGDKMDTDNPMVAADNMADDGKDHAHEEDGDEEDLDA